MKTPISVEKLKAHQTRSFTRKIWEFFYKDENGAVNPERDVPGAELVDHINQLFADYNVVPILADSIDLPPYGISITPGTNGSASITSGLKDTCAFCGQSDCYYDCDESKSGVGDALEDQISRFVYNAQCDALESFILACHCGGVDCTTSGFCEAIVTCVQAIGYNLCEVLPEGLTAEIVDEQVKKSAEAEVFDTLEEVLQAATEGSISLAECRSRAEKLKIDAGMDCEFRLVRIEQKQNTVKSTPAVWVDVFMGIFRLASERATFLRVADCPADWRCTDLRPVYKTEAKPTASGEN